LNYKNSRRPTVVIIRCNYIYVLVIYFTLQVNNNNYSNIITVINMNSKLKSLPFQINKCEKRNFSQHINQINIRTMLKDFQNTKIITDVAETEDVVWILGDLR